MPWKYLVFKKYYSTTSTKDNKVDVCDICCPLFPNDPSNHNVRTPGYMQLNMSMSNTGQCSQSRGDLSSTTTSLIEFLLISNLVPPRIVTCYSSLAWHRSMDRAIIIHHNLGSLICWYNRKMENNSIWCSFIYLFIYLFIRLLSVPHPCVCTEAFIDQMIS